MKQRDVAIDFMKGLLTVLMTMFHLLCATPFIETSKKALEFGNYVNLTSFSGFMFCFGYVNWKAYINNDNVNVEHRIKETIKKIFFAYYCSALTCEILLNGWSETVVQVLLLQKIPSMSEYLLSFCLIEIVVLFTRKYLRKIDFACTLRIIFCSLAMTYFPYELIVSPVVGSILGTTAYSCFPVVQYLLYFITGMWFAKTEKIFSVRMSLLAILGICLFGL